MAAARDNMTDIVKMTATDLIRRDTVEFAHMTQRISLKLPMINANYDDIRVKEQMMSNIVRTVTGSRLLFAKCKYVCKCEWTRGFHDIGESTDVIAVKLQSNFSPTDAFLQYLASMQRDFVIVRPDRIFLFFVRTGIKGLTMTAANFVAKLAHAQMCDTCKINVVIAKDDDSTTCNVCRSLPENDCVFKHKCAVCREYILGEGWRCAECTDGIYHATCAAKLHDDDIDLWTCANCRRVTNALPCDMLDNASI